MIFGEKFGKEPAFNRMYKLPDSTVDTVTEKKSKIETFSELVDRACDGLMEKQIKYSIRRISEMEEQLSVLEYELDEFLKTKAEN